MTTTTRTPATIGCPRCPNRWTGHNTAHCPTCHQTFTGITAFDRHRTGSHTTGRTCLPPTQAGLADAGRNYPCWGHPTTDKRWNRKKSQPQNTPAGTTTPDMP